MVDAGDYEVRLLREKDIVYSELDAAGGRAVQIPPILAGKGLYVLDGDGAESHAHRHGHAALGGLGGYNCKVSERPQGPYKASEAARLKAVVVGNQDSHCKSEIIFANIIEIQQKNS